MCPIALQATYFFEKKKEGCIEISDGQDENYVYSLARGEEILVNER